MRWTPPGAQAVLARRAVRRNGAWDACWPFHRQERHQRRSGVATPLPAPAEDQARAFAA